MTVSKIEFTDDNHNHFTIEFMPTQHYRLAATNGERWREWNARPDEIPNILNFVQSFSHLAEEMIARTKGGS
jgi:hypothetical protein